MAWTVSSAAAMARGKSMRKIRLCKRKEALTHGKSKKSYSLHGRDISIFEDANLADPVCKEGHAARPTAQLHSLFEMMPQHPKFGGLPMKIFIAKHLSALLPCLQRQGFALVMLVFVSLVLVFACHREEAVQKADLTPKERQWLQDNADRLIVPFDRKFPPIEFLNDDNDFDGMARDLFRMIEEALDVRFIYKPATSWTELLDDVRTGRAAIAPTIVNNPQRREYINFTTPYISLPLVIITAKNYNGGQTLEALRGRKVAVIRDYNAARYVRENFQGQFTIVEVPNIQTGLRDVSFGVVDALVDNLAVAAFYIEKEGLPNLKVAGNAGFEYSLSIGSSKTMPELGGILDKAMRAIPQSRIKGITRKWISLDTEGWFVREWIMWAAGGLLVFLLGGAVVIGIFNRILQRKVAHRTEALRRELEERQRTQNALRQAEERYRGMFMNSPVGVFRMTPKGRFIDVNPSMCRMLGYGSQREAMSSLRVDGLEAHLVETNMAGVIREILSRSGVSLAEKVMRRSSGEQFSARLWFLAERDAGGHVLYIDGLAEDITEQRKAQEQLIQARDAAEAANRSKGEFLANMSHEIRTPLNGMFGMLQLLEMTELDESQRHYVDMARTTGKSLLTILSDILDLSRMEAGQLSLVEDGMDVRQIVASVGATFAIQAGEADIDLQWNVAGDVPKEVKGDAGRLRQVLFNLVGNAIKFSKQGTIRMEAFMLPHGRKHGRGLLCFRVHDSGIGIADDKLRDIFLPFNQGDISYRKAYQGTGLGLGIVRKLVELMGGSLAVDSEEGRGTDIYFTIRVRLDSIDAAPEHAAPEDYLELPEGKGRRVIVAEDDAVSLRSLTEYLERNGYYVYAARNGREVLDILEARPADCILMDVQMPLMSGVDATLAIRGAKELGARAKIPIIALTAYAMPDDRERFLNAGMNEYLSKPVDLGALAETMDRVMTPPSGEHSPTSFSH
jgi:two-component system sensor histidine kinase EvgS